MLEQELHVVAALVHALHVLPEDGQRIVVGVAGLELEEGGLEEVEVRVDFLFLAFVEGLALVGSLGLEAVDGGEEGGHAGEVAAGLPVLPADLAEGEAGGVVEGEQEEPAPVACMEPIQRIMDLLPAGRFPLLPGRLADLLVLWPCLLCWSGLLLLDGLF